MSRTDQLLLVAVLIPVLFHYLIGDIRSTLTLGTAAWFIVGILCFKERIRANRRLMAFLHWIF